MWSQQVTMIDSSRLLFIFHNFGVAIIPVSWIHQKPVIQPLPSLLFGSHEYETALFDRQGNWWLATTEEGLQKISPQKQFFSSELLINQKEKEQTKYEVVSVNRQKDILWISTYGDGFFELNLHNGKQEQHLFQSTGKNIWTNFIWNIHPLGKDTLLIGTQAGLFWYTTSNDKYGRLPGYPGKPAILDSVAITTQFIDSHGLNWMGLGKGKGLCCYDNKSQHFTYYPGSSVHGYPFRYPTGITEDKQQNLWFVSDASTELVYWKRSTGQFQVIHLPPSMKEQLSNL